MSVPQRCRFCIGRRPAHGTICFAAVCGLLLLVAQIATRASGSVAESAQLTDVTARAGIDFTHYNGAFGKKFLPETMGSGVAFVDIDNDGDQDLILADGTDWPGQTGGVTSAEVVSSQDSAKFATSTVNPRPRNAADRAKAGTTKSPAKAPAPARRHTPRLYLNNGDGTFVDATARAGLDIDIYGMGIAAADYDNDGWPDLLFTAVGQNRLFHNTGRGTFVDVTDRAGLGGRSAFSTSAMWFDYDRDGRLDLFICNYVKWTPETDIYCSANGREKTYCTPEAYRGSTSWLFHNRGDGTFEDATASAGIFDVTSKSLGVTMLDYDQDGWADVFVANDTQPNKLYRNNRNGTFTELGLQSGLAFSEDGRARAGMGVDAADFDNTGRPTVIVTNFSGEMLGLYAPSGGGRYVDLAPRSDVGRVTRHTLGWGCFFFDFDLDGLQDLLIVNGHLDDVVTRGQSAVKYAERPHLFLNRGADRGFQDIADTLGAEFATPKVGRGAAFADIDADGDLDIVITTNAGPAFLYRNELLSSATRPAPSPSNAARTLRLKLRGVTSNRDAIGALVRVTVGGQRLSRFVKTGSSYLSQSELPLTFGLGSAAAADDVSIEWPGGQHERLGALKAGAEYEINEGRGIVRTTPFRRTAR
jgi:hypothetical protein